MRKKVSPTDIRGEIGRLRKANAELLGKLAARERDLDEAVDQKAAMAEILRVISRSPTDALPVFRTIVQSAVALCRSMFANLFLFDGEKLHFVATHSTGPDIDKLLRAKYPMRPDRSQVSGRVLLSRSVVHLEDVSADQEYERSFPAAMGWTWRMLGVPMLRDNRPLGAIVVGWAEAGPITKSQEDLLKTFADQAVIALENVRLFDEIQEKSRQLDLANTYKTRFLAAASHDLRQPLHALNLFVAQLQVEPNPVERDRLVARVEAAVNAINELFNALLDMSKLEAGVLEPEVAEFPVTRLLDRVETTFSGSAREKGIRLRAVPSTAWVRSDFVLLERILFNFVSNAVRHTERGGVVIGCRRRGDFLRMEVWDSGPGIPVEQQKNVFSEFYQLADADRERGAGLGLGLAIVERLGRLLRHPVDLSSWPGRGSRFAVSVPLVSEDAKPASAHPATAMPLDPAHGKVILVIDDDALVLDSMRGLLQSWGCTVVTVGSGEEALARLACVGHSPDLIVADYRLADGKSGIEAIQLLRRALAISTPAFLISGDTIPERLHEAKASGFLLLHKPVPAMTLRTVLNRFLQARAAPAAAVPRPQARPSPDDDVDPRPTCVPR